MQKGENDIKEAQVEKGLRTSPHKSAQKLKEPSKWWKDKTPKAKIWIKDSLKKTKEKQNKKINLQNQTNRNKSKDTETEKTRTDTCLQK